MGTEWRSNSTRMTAGDNLAKVYTAFMLVEGVFLTAFPSTCRQSYAYCWTGNTPWGPHAGHVKGIGWRAMSAHPDPDKDEPVKVPLDPEEALRALLQVKPGEHSRREGWAVTPSKCGGCGATMTVSRKVAGVIWSFCPNDPELPN